MPFNEPQTVRKDKNIVWTKTVIKSADIELASVPKQERSSAPRRRSRRKKGKRKKKSLLDTLCILNPAARTLAAVRREIAEYVDSERFVISDWSLRFSDEAEEEKFLDQWRGIGTLRMFSLLIVAVLGIKYIALRERLKGHEAVAIIVSFTPCVFGLVVLYLAKRRKLWTFANYDKVVGLFVTVVSLSLTIQSLLQRVLPSDEIHVGLDCGLLYLSSAVKGLLWFAAIGLSLRFSSSVFILGICAAAELVALHVQPGRALSFGNVVSAMWSLGITTLFSIISSHKIEAKARRNFAIANDFWRKKVNKKKYLESQYSTRCAGEFCYCLKDSSTALEYGKFEEASHSKYVLSKIASTILICVVGSIVFLVLMIPEDKGVPGEINYREIYTQTMLPVFYLSLPSLVLLAVLSVLIAKKSKKLQSCYNINAMLPKLIVFGGLPLLFASGWMIAMEHSEKLGQNLYNSHTINQTCACDRCAACWNHIKEENLNMRDWMELQGLARSNKGGTAMLKGKLVNDRICRLSGATMDRVNLTSTCSTENLPSVFFCNSYYATTYTVWVLQTITLLSTSEVVVGSMGIITSGVIRIAAARFFTADPRLFSIVEFFYQDSIYHVFGILAIREVEKNSQEYFFALKHRRQRFVELLE
jgi:hypothetical protein